MLDERSERSGDGPPAAGPDRIVRLETGALNQALDSLLPELRDDDSVLVMDAGSILAPGFVSEARRRL
jgi:hypothetical protein